MDLREAQLGPTNRHPWERARARALAHLLRDSPVPPRPAILDIGCGDGWALHTLGRRLAARRCVGMDPALAHRPPATDWLAEVETHTRLVDLFGQRFDLVLLLDVLEHVDDDRRLLESASAFLAPQGRLLITVPAYPLLYSALDEFLEHRRRYRRRDLRQLLRNVGLVAEREGALFGSLLAPRLASVATQRLLGWRPRTTGVGAWERNRWITRALTAALGVDNRLLLQLSRAGIEAPGLTQWALCRAR